MKIWKSVQKTFHTEVISGGRITIPSYVRKKLGLKDGSAVKIIISNDEDDDNE